MALADFLAGPPERHPLVERDIVTDDGGLADHHPQTMIDEQTSPDLRPGMDFNSGKQARHLRQPARGQKEALVPQPVIDALEPNRRHPADEKINSHPRPPRATLLHPPPTVL